ncbi:MAG: hypothetical protein MJ246_03655 [Clostridia bacterium]|nr:hypothetical protein [Clostridia bacterium]
MGEEDLIESESQKPFTCPYRDARRDCDGDWDYYCHKYNGSCPYMKVVRDVDRDIVQLCRL